MKKNNKVDSDREKYLFNNRCMYKAKDTDGCDMEIKKEALYYTKTAVLSSSV